MICQACNREQHPFQVFTLGRGMVAHCSFEDCGAGVPTERDQNSEAAEVAPIAVASATASPSSAEPLDVIALASARLTFVRCKVAQLRSFEREEKKLQALLAAAEILDADEQADAICGNANGVASTFVGH